DLVHLHLGVETPLGEYVVEELPGLRVRRTAVPEQELDLHSCTVASESCVAWTGVETSRGRAPARSRRPGTSAGRRSRPGRARSRGRCCPPRARGRPRLACMGPAAARPA